MRKFIMILSFVLFGSAFATAQNVDTRMQDKHKKWSLVYQAIGQVESRGKADAVSRDGLYVGYLQISKILVRACNQIAGYQKYTYNDRYSKEKSIQMFIDFQEYYNPEGNIERAIRLWNSGDLNCMNHKAATERYYQRVMSSYTGLAKLQ